MPRTLPWTLGRLIGPVCPLGDLHLFRVRLGYLLCCLLVSVACEIRPQCRPAPLLAPAFLSNSTPSSQTIPIVRMAAGSAA
jgi:hypothetical protein